MTMIEPIEKVAQLPLDDDLEYTRKLKRKLIENSFDTEGRIINDDDPKKRDFTLKLLESLDKTAIARKRIQVDEGANEIQRETNGFLRQLHNNALTDPFRVSVPVEREVDVDLGDTPLPEVNEHMLSQVPEAGKTNFDNFRKDFLEKNPEYDD